MPTNWCITSMLCITKTHHRLTVAKLHGCVCCCRHYCRCCHHRGFVKYASSLVPHRNMLIQKQFTKAGAPAATAWVARPYNMWVYALSRSLPFTLTHSLTQPIFTVVWYIRESTGEAFRFGRYAYHVLQCIYVGIAGPFRDVDGIQDARIHTVCVCVRRITDNFASGAR